MKKLSTKQLILFFSLAIAGIATRMLPHPPNFTAVAAISLFAGAILNSRWLAIAVPFILMYATDFIINNTTSRPFFPEKEGLVFGADYMLWVYGGIALTVFIGAKFLKKRTGGKLLLASVTASLIFWIISNFGVWIQPGGYPETLWGIAACYAAALPYLHVPMLGDLIYTFVIFGAYELVNARFFTKQFAQERVG